MSDGQAPWYMAAWRPIDDLLRSVNNGIRAAFRYLRIAQVVLILGVLLLIMTAVSGIVWPWLFPYLYAASTLFLMIPTVILLALVSLPLRAKSLKRLVKKGYPQNAKEMAIRVVARKLHDQSIETEELLWDTAVNESRKALKKFQERAERLREELEAAEGTSEGAADDEAAPGRCQALTKRGSRCRRNAQDGSRFCSAHQ